MRRGLIGALCVLALVLVGGCGGGGDVGHEPVPRISALATSLTLRPDGTGAYNGLSDYPSSGSNWEKVDDVSPDGELTYVYATEGSYENDAYTLTNHTTETGTINSVRVYFRIRIWSTYWDGTGYCQPFLRLGTSEVNGTEQSHKSVPWSTYSQTLPRPGGGSWSWTDIDNLQVGIRLRQSLAGAIYCTQVYVAVDYTANQTPVADPQSGLTVDSCSTLTVTLTGSDPDSDPLTYTISTLPLHGDLYDGPNTSGHQIVSGDLPYTVGDSNHRVTYQANDSYSGGDSFGFRVNDGMVDSTEATISITVSDGRTTYYHDFDLDGATNDTDTQVVCNDPDGSGIAWVGIASRQSDCDDRDDSVYPGAPELCDGKDNDCDGFIDEGAVGATWYQDSDGDLYGNATVSQQACAQPSGYVLDSTDCDDSNAAVNPGATEVCNGIDDDCDGFIDEGTIGPTWYQDNDSDGYGNSTVSQQACSAPAGYVADNTDCDDNDGTVYPDAPELSDGKDNNCDGKTDEKYYYPITGPVPLTHILLTYSTRGGAVTDPGEGVYYMLAPGAVVNLTATADAGYRFVGWTGGPDIIADVNAATTSVTMNRDCAIEANFAEILEPLEIGQYNLTASSTSGGSVTVPGEGTFTYGASTVADLVAKADSGYKFVNWTGNVTTVANVNGATTTITMNGDYSIIADFAKIPPGRVTLTISSGPRGSVTTPGEATFTYDEGTVVNLKAEPEESCRFLGWTGDVDDVADVTAASTTITMNENCSINAMFKFGTGCFIATAAYGTPMADEIQILREFRDEYLLSNPVGRTLVNIYYAVSPRIAEFITEHPGLKPIVRFGLSPAIAMSTLAVDMALGEKLAVAGLLVLFFVALAIWLARRRGRSPQYV